MIRSHSTIKGRNFSAIYPEINSHVLNRGETVESRNGATLEVLDFKTSVENPVERCVGGFGRNINVFFLIAEALWIWAGRNDVEFLTTFNSKMGDFSDNGKTFNAAYGFRLRHYGVDANDTFLAEQKDDNLRRYSSEDENPGIKVFSGKEWEPLNFNIDQIKWVLNLLHQDPETRRAVVTIWNPKFDTKPSKDIPCNDMLMFKIRNGQLNMTIANRSNDLHWGLCTNIFQFSFLLEIMAEILGVQVGHQTHNSQSLHIYRDNPISDIMAKNAEQNPNLPYDLYEYVRASRMGFDFDHYRFRNDDAIENRLEVVDNLVNGILQDLTWNTKHSRTYAHLQTKYQDAPVYFKHVLNILRIYVDYACHTPRKEGDRLDAISNLIHYYSAGFKDVCQDYYLLAINWFAQRCDPDKVKQLVGTENLFPNFDNEWLGKL